MTTETRDVINLDMTDVKRAAAVLSRAFQEDPVFSYFIPDPETRKAKSHYIFEMLVQYSIRYGEVYATPDFECVATVLPDDKVEMNFRNALTNGGLPIITRLNPVSVIRQLKVTDLMCSVHKELAPYPHIYGYLIGVEPNLRGQGYFSILNKHIMDKADSQQLPFYCDNVNEANIPKYEHHGMKIIREYTIPKTQVRIWAMVREPAKT